MLKRPFMKRRGQYGAIQPAKQRSVPIGRNMLAKRWAATAADQRSGTSKQCGNETMNDAYASEADPAKPATTAPPRAAYIDEYHCTRNKVNCYGRLIPSAELQNA